MTIRARWRAVATLFAAALLVSGGAHAARFGVPPGVPPGPAAGSPAGWLVLVSPDTVNGTVSDAMGDTAHFMTFYIEVGDPTVPLSVSLYDPGLYDPTGTNGQLDANLDPPGGVGTMRYILFGPDQATGAPDTALADMTFGADTVATDRQLVSLYQRANPRPGLYHLVCELEETVADTQDISVFGISVPGHQVYSYNLTVGHVKDGLAGDPRQGGARITEPVSMFPWVMAASPGNDAFGPVCGLRFVTYDMEADVNGVEPPDTAVTTQQGFVFPPGQVPPSGDSRWWATDLGGIDAAPLDSSDHGVWRWDFSRLDQGELEDAFSNLDPPIDLNVFSVQLIDHGSPDRTFTNWPDVPNRPPFILFNPAAPRRIYLPQDDGTGPRRALLEHHAAVVGGFPVVANGETSTLEVTVEITNPNAWSLANLVGQTTVAPGPEITDPVLVGMTGLAVTVTGRRLDFSGTVRAGETASFRYRVDLTPPALGRAFLTGDGVDFVSSATAPTVATYDAPYCDPGGFELPQETLGPICQLEYDAVVPPCAVDAEIVPSGPLQTCPGTEVTLDASTTQVFHCDSIGGVPIYQWSVNGSVFAPFPDAPTAITVTPFANDTWTFEAACSTSPMDCLGSASVTFDLYEAPQVDAGADVEACAGAPVTLTAAVMTANPPASGFLWTTDPPGADGDGATTDTITVAPATTTTYTFTAQDAQGCTGSDDVVVTLRMPQPTVTPDAPELCPGESAEIVATAGFASYRWSSSPPGLPGDGSTGDRVTVDSVGATWTVTVTDDLGCTGMAVATVTAAPDLAPVITPAVPQFCPGGSLGLVGEPGFVLYAWSTTPPGLPGDGATTPNVVASDLGATYTLTVTDARGCTGATSVTTSEKPPFEPPIAPPSPEICGTDPVTLTGGAGYVEYHWSTVPAGLPGDGATTRSIVTDQVGTYVLEVVDTEACHGTAQVDVVASSDTVPGPVGPTLRAEKSGTTDLRVTWADIADPVSGYELLSLDCDADLDGTCDTDPTVATLAGSPTTSAVELPGVQEHVESGGLQRASWLVFYKVRALSPCSATPGPFYTP